MDFTIAGVAEYRETTLGGLPAMESVAKYRGGKDQHPRMRRSTVAIRKDVPAGTMEVIYCVTLDTTMERASADIPTYDAIRASFHLDLIQ